MRMLSLTKGFQLRNYGGYLHVIMKVMIIINNNNVSDRPIVLLLFVVCFFFFCFKQDVRIRNFKDSEISSGYQQFVA